MKKLLIIAALLLSGCMEEQRAEELRVIQTQLPEGCVIADIGGYANIRHVLIVTCEGRDTLSLNGSFSRQSGKTSQRYGQTVFQIGEVG